MTELIIVRHGQANSAAKDAKSYDRLSDLGHQQARWLGAHFAQTNPHFDECKSGTLQRQRATLESMGHASDGTDTRLNEFDYFGLAQAMLDKFGIPMPQDNADFVRHAPQLLAYWQQGQIGEGQESFADFETRIMAAFADYADHGGRILLVTSGGVIAMFLRNLLGLDNDGHARIMLATMNSSVHRVVHVHGEYILSGFNGIPHLEAADRALSRTFV
ncbi:histidine phosphatase family protein [Algirhabdus cladophorae]|uniref:histidine phosphatase family protein n=1 Tax=Algirhabdus cladophorae TaxID=3377108 RepID=UPI003B848995